MLQPYLNTDHERFLPNPSQLIACNRLSYTYVNDKWFLIK